MELRLHAMHVSDCLLYTSRPIEGFDDEYIYKQFMLLSLHGQTKDAFHKNGQGNWEYDIVAPSYLSLIHI